MTSTIRERLQLVSTATVCTFLCMAAVAAFTTIVRDVVVQPQPLVKSLSLEFSPVRTTRQLTLISKLSFASYRQTYAEQKKQWAKEEEEAEAEEMSKKMNAEGVAVPGEVEGRRGNLIPEYDRSANDFGEGSGGSRGFVAHLNSLLTTSLVGLVDRLASLPVVGPYFDGSGSGRRRQRRVRTDDKLGYPITRSPYVDEETDTVEEGFSGVPPERRERVEQLEHYYPQLLPFERESDSVLLRLSGEVDVKQLWDWNTKAIYLSFLARYRTNRTRLNEVVFLDVIVRDVSLPWKLRRLKGTTAETRSPSEEAAYQGFLRSVRHPVHDAEGVSIDHVAKKVLLKKAAKYSVDDLYSHTLAGTEVEVVVRYQVMSYSGWAPVRELPPARTGPLLAVPHVAPPS